MQRSQIGRKICSSRRLNMRSSQIGREICFSRRLIGEARVSPRGQMQNAVKDEISGIGSANRPTDRRQANVESCDAVFCGMRQRQKMHQHSLVIQHDQVRPRGKREFGSKCMTLMTFFRLCKLKKTKDRRLSLRTRQLRMRSARDVVTQRGREMPTQHYNR